MKKIRDAIRLLRNRRYFIVYHAKYKDSEVYGSLTLTCFGRISEEYLNDINKMIKADGDYTAVVIVFFAEVRRPCRAA